MFFTQISLGALAAFVGTIPFGPINLSVVDAAIKKGLSSAVKMSLGASVVEIGQVLIAYHFGLLVTSQLEESLALRYAIYGAFIAIGLLFFFRKPATDSHSSRKINVGNYAKGAIVGLLNPQAIPFWVFVFAYFRSMDWLGGTSLAIAFFLIGVMIGKFLALGSFALFGEFLSRRVSSVSGWMNRILGAVFITIGLIQLIKG